MQNKHPKWTQITPIVTFKPSHVMKNNYYNQPLTTASATCSKYRENQRYVIPLNK